MFKLSKIFVIEKIKEMERKTSMIHDIFIKWIKW